MPLRLGYEKENPGMYKCARSEGPLSTLVATFLQTQTVLDRGKKNRKEESKLPVECLTISYK